MLKMTRLAMLATALVLAMPAALAPSVASAQGQPAPAATPATPPAAPAATTPPPAPAAAAPAPAAKVGEKTTEIIENPYGLEALWKGGDLVARITLGILVIMHALAPLLDDDRALADGAPALVGCVLVDIRVGIRGIGIRRRGGWDRRRGRGGRCGYVGRPGAGSRGGLAGLLRRFGLYDDNRGAGRQHSRHVWRQRRHEPERQRRAENQPAGRLPARRTA